MICAPVLKLYYFVIFFIIYKQKQIPKTRRNSVRTKSFFRRSSFYLCNLKIFMTKYFSCLIFMFIEFALIFLFSVMLLSAFDYCIFKFIRLIEVSVLTLRIACSNLSKFTIHMYIYLSIHFAYLLVCSDVCIQ